MFKFVFAILLQGLLLIHCLDIMAGTSKATRHCSYAKSRGQQKKVSFINGAKLSSTSRIATQLKGSAKQRLHPGMISSQDCATARYGAVTGLKATEDGMYLLSAGSDSRLRLWDIESGCNTLVNFEIVRLQNKGIQMAVAQDSSLVIVPCMTSVKAFDLWSGRTSVTFRGHYEYVNCCWFSAQDQDEKSMKGKFPSEDEDNWSD